MKQGEKLAALLAALLFLAALVWTFWPGSTTQDGLTKGASVPGEEFSPVPQPSLNLTASIDWGQPASQGAPNWIFDIFTPPVIYYDKSTGTFTVTPPFPDAGPVEAEFELELVEIRKIPFRFQLVSYAGARGNYVLTLENLDTGRDVFCAPGETLAEQGIRVVDFMEKREVAASSRAGSTEAFDLVGEAVIEDNRSGRQFTLRHDRVTYLDKPLALFSSRSGAKIQLATGESWKSGTATYTVKSIYSEGNSATLEKTSTDVGDKVTKTLQASGSFNSSDLSNRKSRLSDSPPGTF